MTQDAAQPIGSTLAAGAVAELRGHAPFDRMTKDHLAWMVARLSLVYFAPDSTVLAPPGGRDDHLFIIRSGGVVGFDPDQRDDDSPRWRLAVGDCFPLGALLGRRAVTSRYRAAGDLFCYRLPAEDFHALMAASPPFRDFATQRLSTLLAESRRSLRRVSLEDGGQPLDRMLRDVVSPSTVICRAGDRLRDVLESMRSARSDSILVVRDDQSADGIFTLRDLRDRVVLAGRTAEVPVGEVMTAAPVSLDSSAYAFEAAAVMAEHGFRHVVVTVDGHAVGIVADTDLFSSTQVGVAAVASAIRNAPDVARLSRCAEQVRALGRQLGGQGMPAEQLTRLVATLNDHITVRVLQIESAAASLSGARYCWLAFGSEGRQEQTFATDQDNGLVFEPAGGEPTEPLRARMLAFARRVNDSLAGCGFPLCKGGVMAGNDKWCLTAEEWRDAFSAWLSAPDAQALLNAAIFFDLRPLAGDMALGTQLREWLAQSAQGRTVFLRLLAETAIGRSPPLGILKDFVVADHEGREDTLDLKTNGAAIFVDAARVMALAQGVPLSGTAERIREAAVRRNLPAADVDGWLDAFHFLQQTRLDHQLRRIEAGQPPDNFVAPDALNALDRRILREALRQARRIQERLRLDYRL